MFLLLLDSFLSVFAAIGFLLCSYWVLGTMSLNVCFFLLLLDFCSNKSVLVAFFCDFLIKKNNNNNFLYSGFLVKKKRRKKKEKENQNCRS